MTKIPRVDFHMHSSVSDGTDSPEQILDLVRQAGFEMFSVTDHDTLAGTAQIRALLKEGDPQYISGIEFSCKDGEGKYHILGYGYDPAAPAINETVALAHSYRDIKAHKRMEFVVNDLGIKLPQEEIDGFLAMENPGKPHLANILVKYGYAENKDQAIRDILNKFKYPSQYVSPEQAIDGILRSGGIPVLAHPIFGSGDQLILGTDMEKRLERLMAFGLQGVEGFYSEYTPEQREFVLGLAEKHGLFVTAGSDYHGRNKTVILGDNGLSEATEVPKGLSGFIERVSGR